MKHAIAALKVNHLTRGPLLSLCAAAERKAPPPEGDGAHNQVWL